MHVGRPTKIHQLDSDQLFTYKGKRRLPSLDNHSDHGTIRNSLDGAGVPLTSRKLILSMHNPKRLLMSPTLHSRDDITLATTTAHTSSTTEIIDTANFRGKSRFALAPAIGAAQTDPFSSWPVACYRDLDRNFSFLTNAFGPTVFGYLQNDRGFDIFKSQAQLALSDPAAFHSLMITPVAIKGKLNGHALPGLSAIWHKSEALRIVKARIDSGNLETCISEGTIYAVMVLMGISAQWGSVERNEFHSSALSRLVFHKGGLEVISRAHPVLEMCILGMAVLNPGLLRSGLYTTTGLNSFEQESQDTKVLLYGLLGFLRGTTELERKDLKGLSSVKSAFAYGTPAHYLLSRAPNHPGIQAHHQEKVQRRLKFHAVLYIFSILLWGTPAQVQEFIMHLQFILSHARVWRNSLRLFQWSLIANIDRGSLMFSKQTWQAYELLCAVDRLDEELQEDVLAYYQCSLTGESGNTSAPDELMSKIRAVMFKPAVDET